MQKLGEVLVSIGAVSAGTLNRALTLQRSTGGRLGTILLEQGIVTEETLARALAKATGRSYAHWERVQNALPDVLALLPAKVAIRAGAVPFEREGRLLRVAMRDPNNLAAEDEIAFVTGKKIESWSIVEFRLAEALERFFGERRSARFRVLSERIEKGITAGSPPPPPPPPPDIRGEPNLAPTPSMKDRTSDFWKGASGSIDEIEIATWRPTSLLRPATPAPAIEIEFAPKEAIIHAHPGARKGRRPDAPIGPTAAPVSLEETRRLILSAETRNDVADAALAYLAHAYGLVALFIARKNDVIGWQARGHGISSSAFHAVRIPFGEPSIFLNVKLSGTPYQGNLPDLPAHAPFLEALGHPPERCAIFPITLRKRVVAFLFLEMQTPVLPPERTREMKALGAAIADGLGALILQQRKNPA